MAIAATAIEIAFWTIVIPAALWALVNMFGGLFYAIGVMLFKVMDLLQSIFRKLAGLGTVYSDGNAVEGDILSYLMKSDIVIDVLISVTVFALGLVILGSIVQMVRLEYTTEGSKNSKEKIFTSALKSLLMFVLIPIVCFVGIRLSNYMLQAVDYATSSSGASTVSGSVFMASTADASKVYSTKNYGSGANLSSLLTSWLATDDYNNSVVECDENVAYVKKFDDMFKVTMSETKAQAEGNCSKTRQKLAKMVSEAFVKVEGVSDDALVIGTQVSSEVTGTTLESYNDRLSYLDIDSVNYFYKVSNINYLTLYLGCYICIKTFFTAAMGLIARIYKIVALFVISPAAIGLQPIDSGGAYSKWKNAFIQNVLSCYGFIVALNLYFMVVGVLQTIELWQNHWIANAFVQFLFVLTGATMIKDLGLLFAGFIGGGDVSADGGKVSGDVAGMAKKVVNVGMGAGNLMKAGLGKFAGFAANRLGTKFGNRITRGGEKAGKEGKAQEEAAQTKINKFEENFKGLHYKDGKVYDKDNKEVKDNKEAIKAAKEIQKLQNKAKTNKEKSASAGERKENLAGIFGGLSSTLNLTAGRDMNRFGDFLKNSELVGSLNNLTGGFFNHLSGSAYKAADEAYLGKEKAKWDKAGKGELFDKVAPKTGKGVISGLKDKLVEKVSNVETAKSMRRADIADKVVQARASRAERDKGIESVETSINNENKVLQDKHDENAQTIKNKEAERDGLANSKEMNTVGYKEVDTAPLHMFMETVLKKFADGLMNQTGFEQMLNAYEPLFFGNKENTILGKYADNSAVKDWFNKILSYATDTSDDARSLLKEHIKDLTIDEAKIYDAANKGAIDKYGTYNDRKTAQEKYKSLGDEIANLESDNKAIDEKKTANESNLKAMKEKHLEVNKPGVDDKEYAEAMKEIMDKIKKSNEDLAKKLGEKGIKATFGEDQKFRIDDQPLLKAMNEIKLAQQQTRESSDNTKILETLKQILETNRKNKK